MNETVREFLQLNANENPGTAAVVGWVIFMVVFSLARGLLSI